MDEAPRMNPVLQEMIDHYEIRKVISVYCHGCDRGDEARIAGAFLEDSMDFHGSYKGSGKALAKRLADAAASGVMSTHLLGQSLIHVDGVQAGADTYFIANVSMKRKDEREVAHLMGGRYVDTFRREEGQWKISKRIVVRDWSISLDADNDWLKSRNFVPGQLKAQDPSYAVLGLLAGLTK
jgi:hypothetical protein